MRLITTILLSALCLQASAQNDADQFVAFLEEVTEAFDLPALEVHIMKGNEVIINHGFGKKSIIQDEAPDDETLFAIASLSKAFTTAAVAMLVEEGKLKWDDAVVKHLPNFRLHDPYVTDHITIEDLLCHRSGLITFDGDLLWYGTDYNREEVVQRIAQRPLSYGFRERFGYQNIMFITAGEVIEAASGISWDDFVQRRILDPLGMQRTTSNFERFSMDRNMAKPHIEGEEIFTMSYENSGGTAALNSCASDLAKWTQFWLNDGVIKGDTLLSKQSINRIYSMHTPLPTSSFDEANNINFKGYGMGWFLMDYHGNKIIHHGGGLPGYITKIALSPKEKTSIVVLTNDMSSAPSLIMYAALDWFRGEDYSQWLDTFLDFKNAADKRNNQKRTERLAEKLEDPILFESSEYVGVYEDEMYGRAEVFLNNGELKLRLVPSKELFSGSLSGWANHSFRFDHNDPFLTYGVVNFDLKRDEILGFTIDLPNQDFHFDKLYFKRIVE